MLKKKKWHKLGNGRSFHSETIGFTAEHVHFEVYFLGTENVFPGENGKIVTCFKSFMMQFSGKVFYVFWQFEIE